MTNRSDHEIQLQLSACLEAAHLGVWDLDLKTETVAWNFPQRDLMGYSEDKTDWVIDDFYSRLPASDQLRVRDAVEKCLKNRKDFFCEFRVIWPDGSVHWMQGRGQPTFDENGTPLRMTGIMLEITEQKRLDQANRLAQRFLHESEERYRTLVAVLSSVVWSMDPEGRIRTPQPTWEEFTGEAFEEYRDFRWIQALHPDDRELFVDRWDQARAQGTQFESDARLWSSKFQTYRSMSARAVPIMTEAGSVREWVAAMKDLHDQRLAEKALRTSEEKFRFTLKHAPLCAAVTDCDLKYTWCHNPHLLFERNEVHKKTAFELLPKEAASELMRWQRQVFETGIGSRNLLQFRRGGHNVTFEVFIDPLHSMQDVIGVSLAAMDITQMKETEETALAASSAKSQFLANISHEIRTPIGVILGYADLAAEIVKVPEAQNFLKTIRRNGQHLLHLIGDILDLSKIEADKLDLEIQTLNVQNALEEVMDAFREKAARKGVYLETDLRGLRKKELVTDPLRFQQILTNVVGNAVKFTSRGGVILRPTLSENSEFILEVEDTGIGMSPDQVQKLFQAFSQADGSLARKFGGTGLGLLLSQSLARRLGGDLTLLRTELNKGSVFQIQIPSLDDSQKQGHETLATPQTSHASFSGRCLLLIEDSKDNQMIIERYLRPLQLEVVTANHGVEGLERASEREFDLILLDIQMPVMDGYETLQQLKARGNRTPVIALTAHAMQTERDKALEAGFQDFITKPIHRDAFLERIRSFLEKESNRLDDFERESALGRLEHQPL